MRYPKHATILFIYDTLIDKGSISNEIIMDVCDVSRRTALRYMSEVRMYLADFYKNQQISYNKKMKRYELE